MDLVELVGKKIRKNVLSMGITEKDWRVLIIDQATAHLLHHTIPMSEVLSYNVAMIERIEEARVGDKEFTAVYFVKMNASIAKIIQKDISSKMYENVFVISIGEIDKKEKGILDSLVERAEKKRSKGGNNHFVYKVVPFDFVPLGTDVFQVPMDLAYYTEKTKYLHSISEKIKSLFQMVQAKCTPVPVGRYAKELADTLDTTGPGKLIILERGVDMYAPLMHSFVFESLLWDLELAGPGYVVVPDEKEPSEESKEKESPEEKGDKKFELNKTHMVWETVKNMQLIHTHETLSSMIKKATNTSHKEDKNNLKRLVKAVQELPAQTRTLKEIKILMGLLEQCVSFFNSNGIKEVAELEQNIATGKDLKGSSFKHIASKEIFRVLEESKLTKQERYRLYLLFISRYGKMQNNEIRKMIEHGYLTHSQVEESEKVIKHLMNRSIKPLTKRKQPISRYVPVVHDIIKTVITNNHDHCKKLEIFMPQKADTLTGTSLRKREFVFKTPTSSEAYDKRPIIVFFIGGITINEISEIREISHHTGTTILIGSTDICSPNTFLDTFKKL
ncbi:syntaxin-binding protein 2 [Nematocida sp. AWRm80]|nr:syntaxin-binding protein 2 [Nematocida sp. AWRm80]